MGVSPTRGRSSTASATPARRSRNRRRESRSADRVAQLTSETRRHAAELAFGTALHRRKGTLVSLPPLVEPAAELTIDEIRRYSRHLIIPDVGVPGQKRLKNAKVLCVGAGGLGSPALMYLAAAGVGTLGIVEFDTVDESNLQRQIIHGTSDVGKSKAVSAKETIAEINPLVTVNLHEERLDSDNAMQIFAGYDLIVDGPDNLA